MFSNYVKISVQNDLADDGKLNMVDGICHRLDGEYPDWKSPTQTYMVPDSFPFRQGDKGPSEEYIIYSLLQKCGEQRKEPMFVTHSCLFCEHIPESGRKKSWVMGETDFVIIHKTRGPIYIEVKATDDGKSYKDAEKQLKKGKLALQKHFETAVKGERTKRKAREVFWYLPTFVAMPNCPRPGPPCVRANALYQEDCSSQVNFDKWWNNKVVTANHPPVDQKIYEDLVIWFVGLLHLKPYRGLCIDNNTMIFLTLNQMNVLADGYPPFLWIRGPAGSGKTYLLIEKAVALAKDILNDQSNRNEKILVLCFSSILCKALERSIKGWLQAPEATNVSSFLHCKTFTELIKELVGFHRPPRDNIDRESSVMQALRILKEKDNVCMYDHILVDEGQDLYGKNWPSLLQLMHRRSQPAQEEMSARRRYFWVMYDSNQHLYFGKKPPLSHVDDIQGSAVLSKVFRNTDNVFKQSKKYFKSLMPNDRPITLGHGVTGLPIKWDNSLASNSLEKKKGEEGAKNKTDEDEEEGAKLVVNWIQKLQNEERVDPEDICILVQNEEKQKLLRDKIDRIGGKSQTGYDLVEKSRNCAVVESIQGFKGLESKVVILFDPPLHSLSPVFCIQELLYTAVSRCSCFLIVISTKEGCIALKSDVGINE